MSHKSSRRRWDGPADVDEDRGMGEEVGYK